MNFYLNNGKRTCKKLINYPLKKKILIGGLWNWSKSAHEVNPWRRNLQNSLRKIGNLHKDGQNKRKMNKKGNHNI